MIKIIIIQGEDKLDPKSLSIPFLVLSTKISLCREMDIHLLTPFGLTDITFQVTSNGEKERPSLRAELDSDTHFRMCDEMTFDAFKESLLGFVEGIVQRRFGVFIDESCRSHIHLKLENVGMPLVWHC